jgi:hypothetical protein
VTLTGQSEPGRADRPWSAIAVVVVAIALIALGIGGRLASAGGAAPSPSRIVRASPSADRAGADRSPGPLPSLAVTGNAVLDVSYPGSTIPGTLSRRVGDVPGPGRYDIGVVCVGPGRLVLAQADRGAGPLEVDCDGQPGRTDLVTEGDGDPMLVTVDNRAAWRVVAATLDVAEATPTPTPTPEPTAVTPAVPCAGARNASEPPDAALIVAAEALPGQRGAWAWNGRAVGAGSDQVSSVSINLGHRPTEIRLAGDACATSWEITARGTGGAASSDNSGLETTIARAENPGQFAGFIAQNRFSVDGLGPGEWIVRAALTFPEGSEVVSWRVRTDAFVFARGLLTVGTQRVPGELLGCPGWFVGDTGGQDDCGPLPWFADGAPTLRLPGPANARFEVPGWALSNGVVAVARTADARRTTTPPPISEADIPDESQFVDLRIPAGDVVVRISVRASRSNAGFDEDYVFHAVVGR